MKIHLKEYLNAAETEQMLLIGYISDLANEYMFGKNGWKARGNLSKEEEKYIKYCNTYADKFYKAVLDRLDIKEAEKLLKRVSKFEFIVLDAYTKERTMQKYDKLANTVHIDREQFENWCCEIMDVSCKNCGKRFSKCELYKVFYDNFVPESAHNLPNCRYAYLKGEFKVEHKRDSGDNKGTEEGRGANK